MRKALWTLTVTLAFVFATSVAAMAMGPLIDTQTQVPLVAQVPLAATAIPKFQQPLPKLTDGIPVVVGEKVDISMCEFQIQILPPGTLGVGTPAPDTWVWGYQNSTTCDPAPGGSYVGPVVVAYRNTPTQMTYYNNLPDAAPYSYVDADGNTVVVPGSNVLAYTQSTDQTLQWADPYSLQVRDTQDPPELLAYPPPVFGAGNPEENNCNHEAKILPPLGPLPATCGDNYGFWLDVNPAPLTRKTYVAPIPAAPHLHGGEIPAMLDGGPDAWWTPDGVKGHGYYTNPNVPTATNAAVYTYPNVQDTAPTWFHDHVLGATRLNVYAGIAGAYYQVDEKQSLPTDANGKPTMTALGLMNGAPDPAVVDQNAPTEELLIPLVIQDRMFDTTGQLLFPNLGLNLEHPYWVPEFVGDVIVVNGKAWPYLDVEPKRYRFLVLNGSNARAYELFLIDPASGVKGPAMYVIGNDQGFLDNAVGILPTNKKPDNKLVVMPGERYEIIIDFAGLPAGTKVLELRNTAQTPYPGGAPVLGQTTGKIMQFNITVCKSGFCGATDTSFNPAVAPAEIRQKGEKIVRLTDPATGVALVAPQKTRQLTLNEYIGPGGPLEILVNNTVYTGHEKGAAGRGDFTPIVTERVFENTTYYSELPYEGETEIWEIVNITADAHPIHPHLVAFQILNREAFDFKAYDAVYNAAFPGDPAKGISPGVYMPGYGPPRDYNTFTSVTMGKKAPVLTTTSCVSSSNPAPFGPGPGPGKLPDGCKALGGNPDITPFLSGVKQPPLPAERGWKDTAISYPGEVLRLMIRFAPTHLQVDTPTAEAYYDFNPDGGHGYVWHCHIIDHEDNEMMRPFSVFPNLGPLVNRTKQQGIDY